MRKFENPFEVYGIKSINIRPIENNTNFPLVGNYYTTALADLFRPYKGLKVRISNDLNADAIIVGQINGTHRKLMESLLAESTADFYTEDYGEVSSSIGDRDDFIINQGAQVKFNVSVKMIQRPTEQDIEYALKSKSKKSIPTSRYIFSEAFEMSTSVNYTVKRTHDDNGNYDTDLGGVVNYTNSKADLDDSLKTMASAFSNIIKNGVIRVF